MHREGLKNQSHGIHLQRGYPFPRLSRRKISLADRRGTFLLPSMNDRQPPPPPPPPCPLTFVASFCPKMFLASFQVNECHVFVHFMPQTVFLRIVGPPNSTSDGQWGSHHNFYDLTLAKRMKQGVFMQKVSRN